MTTTAAEQVAGNKYLLEEILICLPAKSVTRSKLVSKQWRSHISSPQFVQYHSQQQSPNKSHTGIFLTDSERNCRNAEFITFNDLNPTYQTIPSIGFLYDGIRQARTKIKIVNACNGLFLCIVDANYCVCNPTTKMFRLLPQESSLSLLSEFDHYLAFDPSISLHYKVICISRIKDYVIFHIYSSEDQSWKMIRPHLKTIRPHWQGFFLNGSIYWLSYKINLCFDVYNEEMKQIDVPTMTHRCFSTSLAVVGSHLYDLVQDPVRPTTDFRLCEINSDFSEWVTKYHGSVGPMLCAFPQISGICYFFKGICVVEGMRENKAQLVIAIPDKVLLYDLKDKTAKELYNLTGDLGGRDGYKRARAFQFIETLCVV